MKNMNWSLQTRFLHLGLVMTITAQLFSSLIMTVPAKGGTGLIGLTAYQVHVMFGLSAFAIVLIHWLWVFLSEKDRSFSHLFPLTQSGRQLIVDDLRAIRHAEFGNLNQRGGLAGLVQGLGLLAVSAVATTGLFIFLTLSETAKPGFITQAFMEWHSGLATFVWVYWLGHGSMGILHHLNGSDHLSKMFRFDDIERKAKSRCSNPV